MFINQCPPLAHPEPDQPNERIHFRFALGFSQPFDSRTFKTSWSVFQDGTSEVSQRFAAWRARDFSARSANMMMHINAYTRSHWPTCYIISPSVRPSDHRGGPVRRPSTIFGQFLARFLSMEDGTKIRFPGSSGLRHLSNGRDALLRPGNTPHTGQARGSRRSTRKNSERIRAFR